MRLAGFLRAIAARTSHPDVYDTGFDELSLDDEIADVDSVEGSTDGGARRSGTIRPSGSTSVLTTTLAAVTRAETAQQLQPVTKSSSRAIPAVCIQPDASIVVALKQRSCASSLQDQSPRSAGLEPSDASSASEQHPVDDTLQSLQLQRAQRGASQLPRVSNSGLPPSGLSIQGPRQSATVPMKASSLSHPSTAPRATAAIPESMPAGPSVPHRVQHWEDGGRPHSSSRAFQYNSRSRLSCPAPSSDSTDASANSMHPHGCVPFSRLPARALPSRASDSRLHLWLQNDVLNSHSCV